MNVVDFLRANGRPKQLLFLSLTVFQLLSLSYSHQTVIGGKIKQIFLNRQQKMAFSSKNVSHLCEFVLKRTENIIKRNLSVVVFCPFRRSLSVLFMALDRDLMACPRPVKAPGVAKRGVLRPHSRHFAWRNTAFCVPIHGISRCETRHLALPFMASCNAQVALSHLGGIVWRSLSGFCPSIEC